MLLSFCEADSFLEVLSCNACVFIRLLWICQSRLARGSAALSRLAELEARVAELEARGRRLDAEKVEAEKALRKEKRGKESGRCLPSPFCAV